VGERQGGEVPGEVPRGSAHRKTKHHFGRCPREGFKLVPDKKEGERSEDGKEGGEDKDN